MAKATNKQSLKGIANLVAQQGRYGDTELVHMNPAEIAAIEQSFGTELTTNPQTGKKEAFIGAIIAAIATLAAAGIGARSARKQGKKSREAMQEQAYIEGAAPSLLGAGEVEIDELGNLVPGSDVSALIEEMSYGEGGEEIYQLLQENPQLLEQLQESLPEELMGLESGIMTAARGGAVGAPKDVYYFSVPNIQQMMGDPDAQVQNVGNAMMGQLEGNPGQGMVGATPGQIQQMARGGAIYEKKY